MTETRFRMLDAAARVLMAALFVYSGLGKLMDPGAIANRLAGVGFPLPAAAAHVAIAVELGAAATLVAGYRLLATTATLAVYTVMATLLFHQFWMFEGTQRVGQTHQFLKNACILAGLWHIARLALMRTGATEPAGGAVAAGMR